MTTTPVTTPWLTTHEAARLVGVTPRTLYRFIDEGQVKAYRLGRVIRLKAVDVEAFLEARVIEPGSIRHLYPEPHPNGVTAPREADELDR